MKEPAANLNAISHTIPNARHAEYAEQLHAAILVGRVRLSPGNGFAVSGGRGRRVEQDITRLAKVHAATPAFRLGEQDFGEVPHMHAMGCERHAFAAPAGLARAPQVYRGAKAWHPIGVVYSDHLYYF